MKEIRFHQAFDGRYLELFSTAEPLIDLEKLLLGTAIVMHDGVTFCCHWTRIGGHTFCDYTARPLLLDYRGALLSSKVRSCYTYPPNAVGRYENTTEILRTHFHSWCPTLGFASCCVLE